MNTKNDFREPELSKNKTSRACQRRMNYMIKNADTMKNVSVYLSEIKTNAEILKKFPVPKRGEIRHVQISQPLENFSQFF